jgi:hypothetical protein
MAALAMTHAGYVTAGWTIPLVLLAGYSLRTIHRGRQLAEQVPPEERRWS